MLKKGQRPAVCINAVPGSRSGLATPMPTSAPPPQRVLFVDDEPAILSGLGRMLRPLRHEIESEFAGSAAEALARLAQEPFDIVVADIRMPVMDGAALLEQVRRKHPGIIRIVLSGHADVSTALREVPVAQQFIAKPCDASTLRNVILRAIAVRDLLNDTALHARLAALPEIPARPKLDSELSERARDPTATPGDLAKLIARDANMSAQLLRSVNSACFGLPRRIASIEAAISYLGTNILRSLLLGVAARSVLGPRAKLAGYDLEASETRALLGANLAMQFFTDKHTREGVFAAALLQDLGELLLMASQAQVTPQARVALDDAALASDGDAHAQLGAYVLRAWGMPDAIVESVAHHHHPERVVHDTLDLVDAVYVSTLVAEHCLSGRQGCLEHARARLDVFAAGERLQRVLVIAEHWLQQPAQAS
jgi:HD-like signal output (HDOD) protein/CheY-like chemotaxis protein